MTYSITDIMAQVEAARTRLASDPRELTTREYDDNPREVYKQQNIKTSNYVSRLSEERMALSSTPLGEESGVSQEEGVSVITPARTSNRDITGIIAQHVRTERGIKVNIGIQDSEDAKSGSFVELTAELKRHSRLRELKLYQADDYDFQQLYLATRKTLQELTPAQGTGVCMGRLHERGARKQWYANMMVVGKLNADNIVTQVIVYAEGEEFEIEMSSEGLSPRQQQHYYNSGVWGSIAKAAPAPTLATAKRKLFK
jgi:hypothetical protein